MSFEQYKLEPKLAVARYWTLSRGLQPHECPVDIADLTEQTRVALEILDRHLQGREFMVGEEVSIADIAIFGYAPLAPDIGIELGNYPAIVAWIKRFEALPGFIPLADDIAAFEDHLEAMERVNVQH